MFIDHEKFCHNSFNYFTKCMMKLSLSSLQILFRDEKEIASQKEKKSINLIKSI